MSSEERALEFEATVCAVQAVNIEVVGMKWENESVKMEGRHPLTYSEDDFRVKAAELRAFADRFRQLKKEV